MRVCRDAEMFGCWDGAMVLVRRRAARLLGRWGGGLVEWWDGGMAGAGWCIGQKVGGRECGMVEWCDGG